VCGRDARTTAGESAALHAILREFFIMPVVQVTMLQGRTADQKRKIAKRITDALVEEAGARREATVVAFNEVSKESYASGGELMIDKTPPK
jgi:4-oxalocrotonate tautomerase